MHSATPKAAGTSRAQPLFTDARALSVLVRDDHGNSCELGTPSPYIPPHPESGHSNDPNGLFYDPFHGVYHAFVQWTEAVPQAGKLYWYHFVSADLVAWKRLGVHPLHNVSGCSGGGAVAPDGTPTLVVCGGSTATPLNRSSDAHLTQWAQVPGDLTGAAYFPPQVPGKWDCSVARENGGAALCYRVTFGSCTMADSRLRPHQLNGYCDGTKQDGTPQILSYVSDDFKTWQFLGEPWLHNTSSWPSPRDPSQHIHVPRVECPYQLEVGNSYGDKVPQQVLKLSLAGTGKDYAFVGSTAGSNGSTFVPAGDKNADGMLIDRGSFYASAVLADTRDGDAALPRQLLFGWVQNGYDLAQATNPTFDCALSLPRVMGVVSDDAGVAVPTWEIAPEVAELRSPPQPLVLLRNFTVPPATAQRLLLPAPAAGDAIELRLNASHAALAAAGFGPVGFSVRATAGTSTAQAEQTLVYYGAAANASTSQSGSGLEVYGTSRDPHAYAQDIVARPLKPQPTYSLRVFVDKSIIESHVNGRLSTTVRAFPLAEDAINAYVINRGTLPVVIDSVEVWGMRSIWQTM